LGTVGLSVNLTAQLSDLSLIVLILLMFIGRLGPITVFAALSLPEHDRALKYVSEEPLVG
jgi:Trk-type K+ transport system membrane component